MNQSSRYILYLALLAMVLAISSGSSAQEEPAEAAEGEQGITVDNGIRMNFRDVPLETVLDHLSEAVGLVIVKDVDVEGRVTVISRQSLDPDEAVMVLNSVLHGKGYAAIRTGRTLRIVEEDEAKRANIPVRVGRDYEEIAETDEVITQVIPISYTDANELVEDLGGILSDTADIAANESSNAIVMTDTSARIRRVVQVIDALDTAISSVASVEVFPLDYADATDAAELINEIFSREGSRGQSDDPRERFRQMFRGGGGRGGGGDDDNGEGGARESRVHAAADERTNTIVVTASEDNLAVIADLLAELDANPMASQGVFVYDVKNGRAVNLQSVLQTLFDPDRDNSSAQTGAGNRPRRGQSDQLSGRAGSRNQPDEDPPPQNQPQQRGGGDGPGGFRGMMEQLSGDAERSALDLAGQVDIVADEDTNSLLIMTAPANFEHVEAIIEQLDRPVPQVVIKALIAEVTHSDDLDVGAEFTILDVPQGSDLFTDFGLGAATGGLTYRLLETDIEATIRALQEVGKLEVLSRPYILASDNQEAIITVGSEVPFITSSSFTELGGTRSTVRYEDIGIILGVTPNINSDGKVIMDVFPEISAVSGESIEISPGVRAPVIAKRSAETRVAVDDGETIVIGGLMEDQMNEIVSKVPILGDIPLLGLAFQRRETEEIKTELLIFLTPHVAHDGEDLARISDDERSRVRILPDAVEPGAYERYLDDLRSWDPDEVDAFDTDPDPEAELDVSPDPAE